MILESKNNNNTHIFLGIWVKDKQNEQDCVDSLHTGCSDHFGFLDHFAHADAAKCQMQQVQARD